MLLSLDLKLYFSFLSREVNPEKMNQSSISPEKKAFFANYLSEKGDDLTAIPHLSKYFAILYISSPQTHPTFKESFSSKWEDDLKGELKKHFLSESQHEDRQMATKLETCIANFSKSRMKNEQPFEKNHSSGEAKLKAKNNWKVVVKSTENRKVLDMLSRRESLSVGRGEFSEWQSSSLTEAIEMRRKMLEYKLLLRKKEHKMRMKDWESKECLEKSHQKWIFFVK